MEKLKIKTLYLNSEQIINKVTEYILLNNTYISDETLELCYKSVPYNLKKCYENYNNYFSTKDVMYLYKVCHYAWFVQMLNYADDFNEFKECIYDIEFIAYAINKHFYHYLNSDDNIYDYFEFEETISEIIQQYTDEHIADTEPNWYYWEYFTEALVLIKKYDTSDK